MTTDVTVMQNAINGGLRPMVRGPVMLLLGIGLSFPMLSVLLLKLSPPDEQGANTSALQLSDALTSSAALGLAGLLFDPTTRQVLPVLLMSFSLALAAAVISPRAWGVSPGR